MRGNIRDRQQEENNMLEKVFKLKENHTDVKTEILAGITTFMTMAYILAVNPSILSAAGSLYCNSTCITDRYAVYGSIRKLSICTCTWYGTECLLCLYCSNRYELLMADCTDCSICRGYYLHYSFPDECQRSDLQCDPGLS